ncbi:MAG: HAD family hydrolase [Coriobacteriia bacterium]|nr:HAD family hydrolase [Coriobacteriia bacterium]
MPEANGSGGSERRLAEVEVVLFDLDGTLIDTMDLILASMRHATTTVLGEALPDEVLMHNVGVPLIVQMREFAPERAEELLASYRAHNAVVHDELVCGYPGTAEALAQLKEAGYRLAVVTSKSGPVAQRGMAAFDLEGYFDEVVAYEDTTIHKPEPEPLFEAARRLGVDISRCAYVGDSPHDMNAARAAGAVGVAALWGPFAERVLEPGPTLALGCLGDLADALAAARQAREGAV